jgi:hypothetical protein
MPTPRAWSYGEISPSLQKRIDLDSYQRSAKTLRNWKVLREGGIETRPGTNLVAPTKFATDPDMPVVIWPFVFNATDGNVYTIEVGHEYFRFHKNEQQIREVGVTITGISKADPGVVSYSGDDPTEGDEVYISGVYGMSEVNGQWYKVGTVNAGADTFQLKDRDGNNVDTSGFTTYTSGGAFEVVYEVATTYLYSELYELSFAQLNDVIVISHRDDAIATLARTSDLDWTFADMFGNPYQIRIAGISGVAGASSTKTYKYKVTFIDEDGKESLPGCEDSLSISSITNSTAPTVTVSSPHNYEEGDTILIDQASGMTEVNGREFVISVPADYAEETALAIDGITTALPMVVTVLAGHGYSDGDKIVFSMDSGSMEELNDITYATVTSSTPNTFEAYFFGTTTKINSFNFDAFTAGTVRRISPNPTAQTTFTLRNVDSTHWGIFSNPFGDAACGRTTMYINNAAAPTSTAPHVISWDGFNYNGWASIRTTGALAFNIYRESGGVFGFIGTTTAFTFDDVGASPDTSSTPNVYSEPFLDPFNYPSACGFGKQRLWFGGSDNFPNRCTSSLAGDYYNFFSHSPALSSDSFVVDLVSTTRNIVHNIREVAGRMIAFCSEGEFGLGDTDGIIDANDPDAQHFSSHGSTLLTPLLINEIATYVQARNSQVRDLGFAFESNTYKGEERSVRSSHLFRGHTIINWAHQQIPDSIIWIVRDDGTLLGCTYVREEQQASWHRHDMADAAVESVCTVPGDSEDKLYLVVNHTINGATYRTVEVMASRFIDDIMDGVYLDMAIVHDGRNTSDTQLKMTGGTTWAAGESMTIQADANYFDSRGAENVGNSIFIYGDDGAVVKLEITAYTNATHVTAIPDRDVPAALQDTYTTSWSYAQPYADGLWPLEGADVAVFADGFVEANPNNTEDYGTPPTVTDGRIELSQAYAVITVGLPFMCDFEPPDIDSAQAPGGGLINQQKVVNRLSVAVEDTRGLFIGSEAPSDDDDDPRENLQPLQRRGMTAKND